MNLQKWFKKEIRKENVAKNYSKKGRFIPTHIYNKLKSIRICPECKKKFNHPLEIHHIDGNHENQDEKNLSPACKQCHDKLDKQVKKNETTQPNNN